MGIIVNSGEEKSELQKKITADLREKQHANGSDEGERPDFSRNVKKPEYSVEDSAYMRDFKKGKLPTALVFLIFLTVSVAVISVLIFAVAGVK